MNKRKVHRITQYRGHYVAVCGGKYKSGWGSVFPGSLVTCKKCQAKEPEYYD